MKRTLLFLLLMALFMPWAAQGQTTVEIGDGTTTGYYNPIGTYYNYSITEQLYTAEEIGVSGTINSISFYWAFTQEKNFDITVYMANVDAENLSTAISLSEADVVFEGNLVLPATAGWVTIDLDAPFAYDGTSNLLIGVNKTGGSQWFSGNTWQCTATTDIMARYTQNDGSAYTTSTTPGTSNTNRPNIQMVITAGSGPVCEKPETIEASNITGNSAVLTWTGGSGHYNLEYKSGTATEWTAALTNSTATTYTLSGLTPNASYSARVQSVCGDATSGWKSVSFNTPAAIPLVEEFPTNSIPTGWVRYSGLLQNVLDGTEQLSATSSGWYFGANNGVFDSHARLNIYGTTCKYWLVTPSLLMENNVELSFDLALTAYSGTLGAPATTGDDDKFVVLINNGQGWEILRQWDNAGSEYVYNDIANTDIGETIQINLSSYVGQTISVAFYGESTISNADNNLHIDNVSIDYIATCPKPKNLTASNISGHTAEISWVAGGEETAWQLCLNGNENSPINVTTNPYTLTGLDPETDYTVKLRANCGGGDLSNWTSEINFTTDVACPEPSNITISGIEPFAATVNWDGTAGNYNLRYREARGFNYGFEDAEPWEVDNFPPCSTYDGDGLLTYGVTGYSTLPQYTGAFITFSDNSQWPAHTGNQFGFCMDGIPGNGSTATANDDYFILPELSIASGDHFTFWARSVNNSYGLERIKVGVYGGNGTITNYLAGSASEYVEVPITWTQFDYDLSNFAGQTIQLAINVVSSDAFGFLLDDIFVGNPNDNTWDETINNIAANTYTLTGLSDNTYYEVQVQSACGSEDGTSEWIDGGMFMTPDGCGKPTNLAAADITTEEATLSWTGYWNTYNLKYRTAESRDTYYFNDFNSQTIDGWTYNGSFIYGFTDPIYDVAGDYNYFLAMGWDATDEETIVSCELPAYDFGAYVEFYYFGYQTANTLQVGYSTTTNDVEAFTWSEPIDAPLSEYTLYQETLGTGVKYIAWKATASSQEACVFIDDFGIFGETIEAGDWETVSAVTSPYELSGLADDTKYEWQVQGINASCNGGVTEWSKAATFTTLSNCEAPTDLEAIDITSTSATLTWEGTQDDYSVRYRELEHFDGILFEEDFSNGIGDWTMVDCVDGGGVNVLYTNAFSFYYTSQPPQYLVSPELTGIDGSQHLNFLYAAYSSSWPESFKVGYSTTGNDVTSDFTWGEEITTANTSGTYFDEVMPAGTKYFAIQCTSNDAFYLTVTYFTIYSNIIPTGDWIEEDARDTELEITDLNPGLSYQWQVKGADCDDMSWSATSTFTTLEAANGQTTDLAEGWNWFSIHVAIDDPEQAMLMLQQSLGDNASQIKSSEDFNMYFDGEWDAMGDLTEVDNLNMYMIQVENNCTVNLTGTITNPADYSITINPGWNWIGFPSSEVITVEDAFANFEAEDEDRIVSAEEFSMFYDGEWGAMGDLEELTPGQGFMYFYNGTTPTTLVFGTSAKRDSANAKLEKVINVQKRQTARITMPSKSVN